MLKECVYRLLVPALLLASLYPLPAAAQLDDPWGMGIHITKGKHHDGQVSDLCKADKKALRIWAEDGRDVEFAARSLCNNENLFVSPDALVRAGWDEGVAAVVLGLAGFGSFGTKKLQVEIEGRTEGSAVWKPLGSKAYDLNPNEVSIQSIPLDEVWTDMRPFTLRLRVTPKGKMSGTWGIAFDQVSWAVFEPNNKRHRKDPRDG